MDSQQVSCFIPPSPVQFYSWAILAIVKYESTTRFDRILNNELHTNGRGSLHARDGKTRKRCS